jgi:hypothetical protein
MKYKYKLLILPQNITSCEELMNEYAQEGWRIVGPLGDFRLILEKEESLLKTVEDFFEE